MSVVRELPISERRCVVQRNGHGLVRARGWRADPEHGPLRGGVKNRAGSAP
jgi:hypothetical protein